MSLATIAGIGLVTASAAGLAFEGLYRKRDRGTIRLVPSERTPWVEAPAGADRRAFVCKLPIVNRNRRYEQTLVDLAPAVRVLTKSVVTPRELAAAVTVASGDAEARTDGYWAANLLGPGARMEATVRVEIRGTPEELANLHAAVVTLVYKTYGRRDLASFDEEIVLPLSAVKPLPAPVRGEAVSLQCVPTPILTDTDDIAVVIDAHTRAFRRPGDIVAVAESVVAITQRQYFRPTEVTPGFWARRLCYFVPSKGSLSSPHGYQLAMDQIGAFRLVASFFVGALGKAVGKKGWFYSLAGKPAELIDDITGTMPPFDKYLVAGPKDPEAVVARIKALTGMEAAIVDANDLKRVMVLAHTPGVSPDEVARMLLDNPFGNAAEQTPVVVMRPLGASDRETNERDQSCPV